VQRSVRDRRTACPRVGAQDALPQMRRELSRAQARGRCRRRVAHGDARQARPPSAETAAPARGDGKRTRGVAATSRCGRTCGGSGEARAISTASCRSSPEAGGSSCGHVPEARGRESCGGAAKAPPCKSGRSKVAGGSACSRGEARARGPGHRARETCALRCGDGRSSGDSWRRPCTPCRYAGSGPAARSACSRGTHRGTTWSSGDRGCQAGCRWGGCPRARCARCSAARTCAFERRRRRGSCRRAGTGVAARR
jgi:hypothetical protein